MHLKQLARHFTERQLAVQGVAGKIDVLRPLIETPPLTHEQLTDGVQPAAVLTASSGKLITG